MKSSALAWMISTFVFLNCTFKNGIKNWSSSSAVTFFAVRASVSVNMPCPGPISITSSFAVMPAIFTIFSTIEVEVRKFWPRDFLAFMNIFL